MICQPSILPFFGTGYSTIILKRLLEDAADEK
jgi:hypothetical protein